MPLCGLAEFPGPLKAFLCDVDSYDLIYHSCRGDRTLYYTNQPRDSCCLSRQSGESRLSSLILDISLQSFLADIPYGRTEIAARPEQMFLPEEVCKVIMMLLPHVICRRLLQAMDYVGWSIMRCCIYEDMNMIPVGFSDAY